MVYIQPMRSSSYYLQPVARHPLCQNQERLIASKMPLIFRDMDNPISQHALDKSHNHCWIDVQRLLDDLLVRRDFGLENSQVDIVALREAGTEDFNLDQRELRIHALARSRWRCPTPFLEVFGDQPQARLMRPMKSCGISKTRKHHVVWHSFNKQLARCTKYRQRRHNIWDIILDFWH